MSKINLTELRQIIREELEQRILEFVTKEMPNGSAWKLPKGSAWAAKNTNGVTNYWYGKDQVKNKEAAAAWAKDSAKQPHQHAGEKLSASSKEKGIQHPNKPSKPTVGV
jgi:hypothetical protein